MAHSRIPLNHSEAYRGPSREELGGLADWISPEEFFQLHAASRPSQSPTVPPLAEPSPKPSFESGAGSAERELADLVAWIEKGRGHPSERAPPDPGSAPPAHDTTPEIWREELGPVPDHSSGPRAGPSAGVPEGPDLDALLDELDQIRVALQKRPTG